MRMISLLTSNMSGMENSASAARGRIDPGDFPDGKPDSFTNTRPCRQAENPSAMNSFDAAVYLGLVVAVATGFNAGLLRSAITILAYLIAMPIAVWATSLVSPGFDGKLGAPAMQDSLLLFGSCLITSMVLA